MKLNDYFFWMPPDYIPVFSGFGVQVYDVMTALAIAVGFAFWFGSLRKTEIGFIRKLVALGIVGVSAVFFSRAFHILFWALDDYLRMPDRIVGLGYGRSVHGVTFGFALASIIVSRWWKWPLHEITDRLAPWLLIGIVFARVGNFFGSEMIGTESELPWAVRFYFAGDHGTIPRHPVQLYEALSVFGLLGALFWFKHRLSPYPPYASSAIALLGYGLVRLVFDLIRDDPGYLFQERITTGQLLSLPCIVFGVWATVVASREWTARRV